MKSSILIAIKILSSLDMEHPRSAVSLADEINLSLSYLEAIFAILNKEGYVKGVRGPNGGYKRTFELNEITLGKMIKMFDEEAYEKGSKSASNLTSLAAIKLRIFILTDEITLEDLKVAHFNS